jgi:hypothetical protein
MFRKNQGEGARGGRQGLAGTAGDFFWSGRKFWWMPQSWEPTTLLLPLIPHTRREISPKNQGKNAG